MGNRWYVLTLPLWLALPCFLSYALPGNEPYELWEGLDRRSQDYKDLKASRGKILWNAIDNALGLEPGKLESLAEVKLIGNGDGAAIKAERWSVSPHSPFS